MKQLMIFGHPSHELALYGMIQRRRPHILVITDGGGPRRLADSRRGLESIGLLGQARYLNYPEQAFYEALLRKDADYFFAVAEAVRRVIDEVEPDEVFCDAIEFYNPVHDVTLPIVRSALGPQRPVMIYEVPLVYQKDGPGEVYEIQRIPSVLAARRIVYELTPGELDAKVTARNGVYSNLREQAGPEFMEVSREHLGREEFARFLGALPSPGEGGRMLRYEWRARLLQSQGALHDVITFKDNYLPVARALINERITV